MQPVAGYEPDRQPKAKIFISYSRKDLGFANRFDDALKARGFKPLIDREEIYAFEDWWKRLQALIGQADTIVFIVSPDSVISHEVLREVEYGFSLNKRFAPIVCRRVEDTLVPEVLRRLNFVFFDDQARFEASADQLADALRTDIGWVRRHTEYGEASRQWIAARRAGGLLLRSPALEEAEHWIASRPANAPLPTDETHSFIIESRRSATRRREVLTGSLAVGLCIALALAGVAYWQRGIAVEQRSQAIQRLREYLIAQSRGLASAANVSRKENDPEQAIALALEALPINIAEPDRPYVPEAEFALRTAYRASRQNSYSLDWQVHLTGKIDLAALSPNGAMIATVKGSTIEVFNRGGDAADALPNAPGSIWALKFLSDGRLVYATKTRLVVYDPSAKTVDLTAEAQPSQVICGWAFKAGSLDKAFEALYAAETLNADRVQFLADFNRGEMQVATADTSCSPSEIGQMPAMAAQFQGASLLNMHMVGDKLSVAILNPAELTVLSPTNGLKSASATDLQDFTTIFVAPGGDQILAAYASGRVQVLNADTLKSIFEIPTSGPPIVSLDGSADGHQILIGYQSGTVDVLRRATYGDFSSVSAQELAEAASNLSPCTMITADRTVMEPDGSRRIHLAHKTATLIDGKNSASLDAQDTEVLDATFSADGKYVIAMAQQKGGGAKKIQLVYEVSSQRLIDRKEYAFGESTSCAKISPDGRHGIVANDSSVLLVDFETGSVVRDILPEDNSLVALGVAFNSKGDRLAVFDNAGALHLYATSDGKTLDQESLFDIYLGRIRDDTLRDLISNLGVGVGFDKAESRVLIDWPGHAYAWSLSPALQDLVGESRIAVTRCLAPKERISFYLPNHPPDWCIDLAKPPYDTDAWKQWLVAKRAGRNSAPPQPQ